MRFYFFVGAAVAQLLRTAPLEPPHEKTFGEKLLTHAEKIQNITRDLALHTGNATTPEMKTEYSLQTLRKIEAEAMGKRSKADPLTDEMFDPVIDQIRGILRGNVKESIDGLVTAARSAVQTIEQCTDDHGFDATAESSGYNAAKQEMESGGDAAEEECESVTTGIEARDNAGKTLYENVKNSVGCSQTADVADVPMDALNFPLKNINTWAQTVMTQHKEWFEAAQKVTTTTGDCSETKLDSAEACAKVEHLAAQGKQAYETCYNLAKGQYDGAVAALVATSQNQVGPQIDMVESLLCYIRAAIREWDNPQSSCETTDDGKYVCRCDSDQGEIYSGIVYDFGIHLGPYDLSAPEPDTSWDDKGCDMAAEEDPCEDVSGKWTDAGGTVTELVTDPSDPCAGKESSGAWTYTVKGVGDAAVVTLADGTTGPVTGSTGSRTIAWTNGFSYTEGGPPTGPYYLVPSTALGYGTFPLEAQITGYKPVTIDELKADWSTFVTQYNDRGLNLPTKFKSGYCCVMVMGADHVQTLQISAGLVSPSLNGVQSCNPAGGYESATNWKFAQQSSLDANSPPSAADDCLNSGNPMLAVQG